jgi:hypothetical protein
VFTRIVQVKSRVVDDSGGQPLFYFEERPTKVRTDDGETIQHNGASWLAGEEVVGLEWWSEAIRSP